MTGFDKQTGRRVSADTNKITSLSSALQSFASNARSGKQAQRSGASKAEIIGPIAGRRLGVGVGLLNEGGKLGSRGKLGG